MPPKPYKELLEKLRQAQLPKEETIKELKESVAKTLVVLKSDLADFELNDYLDIYELVDSKFYEDGFKNFGVSTQELEELPKNETRLGSVTLGQTDHSVDLTVTVGPGNKVTVYLYKTPANQKLH